MSKTRALDAHWNENADILIEAARRAGVDPAIVIKIAGFESGFDAHARPINHRHPEQNRLRQFDGTMATSTAYGLGQFTDDTWLSTLHRHGAKYGLKNAEHLTLDQANAPELRNNVRLQAAMLAEFTRDNVVRGQRLGGVNPDANVYALHNLGSGDGPRLLEALRTNPDAPVSSVLASRVIKGNPSLYGDGSRTVAEAYRVMGERMDEYARYAAHARGDVHATPSLARNTQSSHTPTRHAGSESIYMEARIHFLDGAPAFEYGRGDAARSKNRSPDGRTDQSRNERDLDGDGRKGVDCSSFVWRALRNAGYDVPTVPFTTHTLFEGGRITPYSRQHFDVIAGAEAARDRGSLKPGDILLFKSNHGAGQHVGIFKGYDAEGHIRFIGSQTSTGPAETGAAPGTWWNGHDFHIVGALRAKPEFQVRAPLHAEAAAKLAEAPSVHAPQHQTRARLADGAEHALESVRLGDQGAAVATLQRRLFDLGYHTQNGEPLPVDGKFGPDTLYALKEFQREHGLEGKGIAGPKTEAALRKAETALMSDPSHPQHALFMQAVAKVAEAEKAKGIAVGPHTQRIAGAVVVEAVREGLTRIDRVAISDNRTLVWAIDDHKGPAEAGLGRTEGIGLAQASLQPLAESTRQAHQVVVNVELQRAEAQSMTRTPQPQPAMAR